MKHLVALCVVAVMSSGCKAGEKAGSGSGSASGSGSGSGSASASGSGSGSGSTADGCVVVVAITIDTIKYDGGGLKGTVDRKPGELPDLGALKPLVGKCAAMVTADGDIKYQDVIVVMDSLIKIGIIDVSLGKPGDKPEGVKPRPPVNPSDIISTEWKTDASGKLVLEGSFKPTATAKNLLAKAPVVIVTKTEVRIADKVIGKPGDETLDVEVAAALTKASADTTLILQADAETSALAINKIAAGANTKGYDNVLFAVKNK